LFCNHHHIADSNLGRIYQIYPNPYNLSLKYAVADNFGSGGRAQILTLAMLASCDISVNGNGIFYVKMRHIVRHKIKWKSQHAAAVAATMSEEIR